MHTVTNGGAQDLQMLYHYLHKRLHCINAQKAWYHCISLMPQLRAEIMDVIWHATIKLPNISRTAKASAKKQGSCTRLDAAFMDGKTVS
jgi:hypothetical protein